MVEEVWPARGGVPELPARGQGAEISVVDVTQIPGDARVVPRGGARLGVAVVHLPLLGGAEFCVERERGGLDWVMPMGSCSYG